MIIRLAMELIVLALALVGGYSVAGWVGVGVVVAFVITQMADMAIRLRSPRARLLRQIARELRSLDERPNVSRAVLVHDDHVHTVAIEAEVEAIPATSTEE